jgi:predicted Ser/Thr protein kinase
VKTCPVCSREFPDSVKFCPNDGQTLRAKGPLTDLVGQVIADRYHIVRKLGEGGMGAVYLGEHVKMGRRSAIKVMAQAMSNDPEAVGRFNREAANASKLSHPNICQVYDFGETSDGLIYLAMEYIDGKPLNALVDAEGALPPARAAGIVRQAAEALQVAHEQNIVHRDIKPDNIMVFQARDGSDVAKVVDFGIAKAVAGDVTGQKVTKTGLVVGTPEYMSPEQLSGDKLDGRTDIYSLALVLYKLLTGVLPFQAATTQETLVKRLTDDPEPLAVARPDIAFPEGLQRVLDKALARGVAERYASAAEFGREVTAAVSALPLPQTRLNLDHVTQAATQLLDGEAAVKAAHAARRPAPPPTVRRAPPKRFPLGAVGGGVGAVAVLAVIGWLALGRKQPVTLPGADTSAVRQPSDSQPAANPPGNAGRQPQTDRQTTPTETRQTTTTQPGPTVQPPAGNTTAAVAESLRVGSDGAGSPATAISARSALTWVYNSVNATRQQKAEAAFWIANTYDPDGPDSVWTNRWLTRAAELGHTQASETLRMLRSHTIP